MKTLCDTSSVLLLIRIAPQMFIDARFNCFTVREVWEEVFQTQKFRAKYSWRDNFKNEIKVTPRLEIDESLKSHLELIQNLVETGIVNSKTGRYFDLSRKDQKIVASVLAFDSNLSTNDLDMRDFVIQQFNRMCLSSLALLNGWLENNLIAFDSRLQDTIEDWIINNEPVQPDDDIEHFERLTGYRYVGPR